MSENVPRPDPTILTTQVIAREITSLKELLFTRLDGMDKAIDLLQKSTMDYSTRVDEKIGALSQVHEEKFRSIAIQFAERDVRTDQTSRDSKVAVDAALQAAKEAVAEQNRSSALAIAKSETATVKQIDQQGLLIQTTAKASDDKIDDIKERLTRIEGKGEGEKGQAKEAKENSSSIVGIIGLVIGTLIGLSGIIMALLRK